MGSHRKTPKRSVRNTAQRTALKQMWIANPLEGNERAEDISFGPAVVPLTLRIPSGFPSADITVPNSVAYVWRVMTQHDGSDADETPRPLRGASPIWERQEVTAKQ